MDHIGSSTERERYFQTFTLSVPNQKWQIHLWNVLPALFSNPDNCNPYKINPQPRHFLNGFGGRANN